jgi:hypothetical protein
MIKGTFTIEVDKHDRIYIGEDSKLSIKKEIPFVRYRMETYGAEQLNYIKNSMKKFQNSGHIVETIIGKHTFEEQVALSQIEGLALFMALEINDEDVTASAKMEFTRLINAITAGISPEVTPERIVLRDKTTTMHTIDLGRIRNGLKGYNKAYQKDFGVCESPLSFDNEACLTARIARDIASRYCKSNDIALPSSNHESMAGCGCIRYIAVTTDMRIPFSARNASGKASTLKKANNDSGGDSDGATKKKPAAKGNKVMPRIVW